MAFACTNDDCARPVIARGLCTLHYQRFKKSGSTKRPLTRGIAFIQSIAPTDACIIWPFATCSKGRYGAIFFQGRQQVAHRVSLTVHVGPPPSPNMHAAHDPQNCRNSLCINPRHLRWATPTENNADKQIAGTLFCGERNNLSKLTLSQVLAIKADTRAAKIVASEFYVSDATIYRLRRGKSWRWA